MRGQRVRANRSSGSETSGSGKSVRRRLGARRRPDRIKDKVDEVEPKKGTRGERVEIKVLVDVAGANDGKAEEAGERDGMQQRVEVEAEATQGAGASDVGEEKMRQLRCGSEQGAQADHVAGDDVGGWAHPHVAERRPSRARVDGPVGPRQEKRCRHRHSYHSLHNADKPLFAPRGERRRSGGGGAGEGGERALAEGERAVAAKVAEREVGAAGRSVHGEEEDQSRSVGPFQQRHGRVSVDRESQIAGQPARLRDERSDGEQAESDTRRFSGQTAHGLHCVDGADAECKDRGDVVDARKGTNIARWHLRVLTHRPDHAHGDAGEVSDREKSGLEARGRACADPGVVEGGVDDAETGRDHGEREARQIRTRWVDPRVRDHWKEHLALVFTDACQVCGPDAHCQKRRE
mmetsp:Transcript_22588/g.66333  ORF Transcript_22588/g.66333 Transcript_22588/m.66333 type:complete len:406 (+) Transcript_22588:353-1570(+)